MENERYNQHGLWNSESEILNFSDDIPCYILILKCLQWKLKIVQASFLLIFVSKANL